MALSPKLEALLILGLPLLSRIHGRISFPQKTSRRHTKSLQRFLHVGSYTTILLWCWNLPLPQQLNKFLMRSSANAFLGWSLPLCVRPTPPLSRLHHWRPSTISCKRASCFSELQLPGTLLKTTFHVWTISYSGLTQRFFLRRSTITSISASGATQQQQALRPSSSNEEALGLSCHRRSDRSFIPGILQSSISGSQPGWYLQAHHRSQQIKSLSGHSFVQHDFNHKNGLPR